MVINIITKKYFLIKVYIVFLLEIIWFLKMRVEEVKIKIGWGESYKVSF